MALGVKTGGRRKGTLNRSTRDVQAFVDGIFKHCDPEDLALKLLASESDKVRSYLFVRLLEYRYGKPTENVRIEGLDELSAVLSKARSRVNQPANA